MHAPGRAIWAGPAGPRPPLTWLGGRSDASPAAWDQSDGPNPPPAPAAYTAPAAPAPAAAPAAAPQPAGEGAVCYLCRRKFATLEQLQKHEQVLPRADRQYTFNTFKGVYLQY